MVHTLFAEVALVVEVTALANWARIRIDADAAMLTRILLHAHVELAHSNTL